MNDAFLFRVLLFFVPFVPFVVNKYKLLLCDMRDAKKETVL